METNTEELHHNHKTSFEQFMEKLDRLKSHHSGIGMLSIQTKISIKKLKNLIRSRYISQNLMLQIEAEIDPILTQLENLPPEYKTCLDKLFRLNKYSQGINLLVKHCGLKLSEVRGLINGHIPLDPHTYIRINNVIDPILEFLDSQDFTKKTNKKLSNRNDPILKKIEHLKNYRSAVHLLTKSSGLSETTVRNLINNKIELTAFIKKKISAHLDKTLQELEQREIELNKRKHGNYASYIKGCRCEPCKIAMKHYLINLKHRKSLNSSKDGLPVDNLRINSEGLEDYQDVNKECLSKLILVQGYRSGFAMLSKRVDVSYPTLEAATSGKSFLSNYLYEKISPVIDEVLEDLERSHNNLENYQKANKECLNKLVRVQGYRSGFAMLSKRVGVNHLTLRAETSGKPYLISNYLYEKISPVIDEVLEDLERSHNNLENYQKANKECLNKLIRVQDYWSGFAMLSKRVGVSYPTLEAATNGKPFLSKYLYEKISPVIDEVLEDLERSYSSLEDYQKANKECLNKLISVQGYRSGLAMLIKRAGVSYAALRTATNGKQFISNYLYKKISPVIDEVLEELERSDSNLENYQKANKECLNKLIRVQAYWTGSTMLTKRAGVSYPTLKTATSGKPYLSKYLYEKISPVIDEVLEDLERLHSNGGLGKHGKYTTYANDKCRCVHCKAARVNYTKAFKERKASKSAPSHS